MLQTVTTVTDDTLQQIKEEMDIRRASEVFLLFSLGSQFDHLIKQAVEKLGVYCLVADPARVTLDDVKKINPIGIILSGGPSDAHKNPPPFDKNIFNFGIPILGICLGFQMWAHHFGFRVETSNKREFGSHTFTSHDDAPLFEGMPSAMRVLESHGDRVCADERLTNLGNTTHAPVAAARFRHLWGVQFHPEVTETEHGLQIFENFCFKICGARDRYPAEDVAQQKINELKEEIGGTKVLLALSGGSDSSTIAHLLKHAMDRQENLRAVYIKGIDRPDDEAYVKKHFKWLDVVFVDATDRFLDAVNGCASMHEKRVAMRDVYREVLEEEAKRFNADYIAQGSLYTDLSESGGGYDTGARKAQIKLHHNTGLNFSVPELTPLDDCVKDNARQIGRHIGVPEKLLIRHPFPGPGLLVRIEGVVNKENLAIARKIDGIYIEELRKWNLYDTVWQAGAVVTQSVAAHTKGDDSGTGKVVCLWAVWSVDGFTAQAAELPSDFLKMVATRITNEVSEVSCVAYRFSDKPPATIEWG